MTREESNKFKWLSFAVTISIVLFHAHGGAPSTYSGMLDQVVYSVVYDFFEVLEPLAMGYFL